jgi:hypothetical protein
MRGQQCEVCKKESKNYFDEHERCGCSQNTMGNLEISASKSALCFVVLKGTEPNPVGNEVLRDHA